ncbi:MAG TPA: MltA domain-containing protein [Beijerinckiaceae bacterium]|jgi:membrane-bound lytic murein transglycosylase A
MGLALTTSPAYPAADHGGARLEPLPFTALQGWDADDHAAAFSSFLRTCRAIAQGAPAIRLAQATSPELRAVCHRALEFSAPDRTEARRFFERWFTPHLVRPDTGQGFLTGYFEPELPAARESSPDFPIPLLSRPDDLVTLAPGETIPGGDPALQAARTTPTGLVPYPDRGAIEAGALGNHAKPIAWLRDAVDRFVLQVQGSGVLRFSDGGQMRVSYAGRNGHPYTSIGRILVQEGHLPLAAMSLESLTGWLRAHPDEGAALMRRNRSFVFFAPAPAAADAGPIGGAGVPLTAGRSLAVDRARWSYGLPFWLEGRLPGPEGHAPLRSLLVAQDTGTAIVGAARGDYFVGSGAAAGTRAGLIRHQTRFIVLLPRLAGAGEAP